MEFLRKSRTRRSVAKGKDVGPTGDPLDIVSLQKLKKPVLIELFSRL